MALNDRIQADIMVKHYPMEIMNWKDDLIKVEAFNDSRYVHDAIRGTKMSNKEGKLSCIIFITNGKC